MNDFLNHIYKEFDLWESSPRAVINRQTLGLLHIQIVVDIGTDGSLHRRGWQKGYNIVRIDSREKIKDEFAGISSG